jgi:MFS family permease
MMRIGAVVGALVGNAVPVAGIVFFGWSIGTVMLVICIEYLILALLATARMAWHQRRSGDPVHQDPVRRFEALRRSYVPNERETPAQTPSATRMQAQWIFPAFIFLIFAAATPLAFVNKWPEHAALWLPGLAELGVATLALLLSWGASFVSELPTLARRPFRAMAEEAGELQARAVSIALTIIFAGVAVGHFQNPWAWLPVQVLCKLLLDMKLALTTRDEAPLSPRSFTLQDRLLAARQRQAERERARHEQAESGDPRS